MRGSPRPAGPAPARLRPAALVLLASTVSALVAPARATAQAAPATLTVAAYNIKHGRGADGVVDLGRIAADLRALDADVITLQEVDRGTERTGRVDQTAVLASLLGYAGSFGAHRPYQGGEYGNAVLTRLPLLLERTHAIPPASGSALSVHEVEVEVPGFGRISVVSVHLAGTPEERTAQAERVTGIFAGAARPVLLAGDFNGRPDDVAVERLRRSWRVLEKSGPPETYPAEAPDREIDFVMVGGAAGVAPGGGAGVVDVSEHVVAPGPVTSDHRPVVVRLRLGLPPAPRREEG